MRNRAIATLVAAVVVLIVLLGSSTAGSPRPEQEPEDEPEVAIVYDTPAEEPVPVYTQLDERWGGLPYAGSDLATAGCGLTCAAMAWEHLSGHEWTPVQMLNAVGNSCVQGGQNYMPGFCEWMREQDPTVSYTTQYEDANRALADLEAGGLVFGSLTGRLEEGGREYDGHIVLLTSYDGQSVTIHDPCKVYEIVLDTERFASVDWVYFITIGRG